jgi:uncharacterized membrane protein YhiD involved in acid resistance
MTLLRVLVVGLLIVEGAGAWVSQPSAQAAVPTPDQAAVSAIENGSLTLREQMDSMRSAALALPLAAALGAVLAFRPRRRGTPERSAPVIQTQIILAIVGSMVMLVVGASLARAFGIVGAASLVRYRAKIDDPKDAGVMLSTLAVGLATGVGLYLLAVASTVFVLAVLWVVESLEPARRKVFTLRVKAADPGAMRPEVERLLRRFQARFELRTTASDEVCYEVLLPYEQRTDRLSTEIAGLDPSGTTAVEWEEKKAKS